MDDRQKTVLRMQYEGPAGPASTVARRDATVLELLQLHSSGQRQYMTLDVIDTMERLLIANVADIRRWQQNAQMLTDYDMAREAVTREFRGKEKMHG